jgi:hypothetical protein
MDRNILPPGLAGYVMAQQQGQHNTTNQIQQLGGLLQMQGVVDARNEQAALKNSVVMTPDGQMDARATLSNLYKISPAIGLKFQQALQKETQFAKVDPKDYTPESVAAFARSGSHADLVPVRKREAVNRGNVVDFVDPYTQTGPLSVGVSPNTSATLAQSQNQFNATLPLQQANAGVNLSRLYYDTGMAPAAVGGFSPAQIQAAGAPPAAPPAAPLPASRTPTPPSFPRVSPQEQAQRDAGAARIVTAEQNGGAGMIPTANVVQGSQPPPARPLTPRQEAEKAAKRPERIQSLRKEFNDVQDVKNYKTVLPIIESARNAPDNPAGDLDLIYSVGKILDPTSVVREGEMNLVIKSGSPIQRFQGTVNYITSGRGRLPAAQRAELLAMLDGRVGQIKAGYDNAVSMYTKSAQAEGLPLDQIIQQTTPAPKSPSAKSRTVTRTGTINGKKVVQYSDGTTEYAQ